MISTYKNGKIYKIITSESNEIYIGSTFDTITNRFKGHKRQYKFWKNGKGGKQLSFDIFEKYGLEKCKIMLIKEYSVVDKRHLEVYESLWIRKLNSINKLSPVGGMLEKQRNKQYRIVNKDELKLKKQIYYENNKDEINKKRKPYFKEYRENNKEKAKEWREKNKETLLAKNRIYYNENKERAKIYKEKNKDKIKQQWKEYYENNKDTLKEKRRVKIKCQICGEQMNKASLNRHKLRKH